MSPRGHASEIPSDQVADDTDGPSLPPHVCASRAVRFWAGVSAAPVPDDSAETHGAYDARSGAERTAVSGVQALRDTELLAWCGEIIRSVLADLPGA